MPASSEALKAARAECAEYFQESCTSGLYPLGDFWQRAVLLAQKKHPDVPATATLVRVTNLLDHIKDKKEDYDKYNGLLRGIAEPSEGWPLGSDDFPSSDTSESRASCRAFISQVLHVANAEQDRLNAHIERANSGASGPPPKKGGPADGALHIKGSRERDEERIATARAWQQKHVPPHTPWPAQVMPARAMLLLFEEWRTNTTAPEIKQLAEYIKAGRAQTQPAGRPPCRLQDVISVLLAMATMYAGPCPAGCKVDPKVDVTMIEWDDDGGGQPARLKRPAALSFPVVAEAIATLTVALSPLNEAQKIEHSDKIWNSVINEVATLGGRTLSHALNNAMKSRSVENALQEAAARTRDRSPNTGPGKAGKKRKGPDDSPGRERDRDRDPKKEARKDRPVCPDWEEDGACSAHAQGKCKDRRHPEAWRGVGRAAATRK